MRCTSAWLYIQWVASFATHATCLITLMHVEIQWVTNDHYNSKTKLQAQLQYTFFFHNVFSSFLWYLKTSSERLKLVLWKFLIKHQNWFFDSLELSIKNSHIPYTYQVVLSFEQTMLPNINNL
jgi:hypothetical protein